MKPLIALCLLLLALPSFAGQVTLAWDANTEPELSGYAIFDRNYQKPYNYGTPIWEGPQTTCTVTVPDDRQSAFVARAFAWGPYDLDGNRTRIWSENSNEVVSIPTVAKPAPPRNLLIKILAALAKLFGGIFG